jgi:hypothetical protein
LHILAIEDNWRSRYSCLSYRFPPPSSKHQIAKKTLRSSEKLLLAFSLVQCAPSIAREYNAFFCLD